MRLRKLMTVSLSLAMAMSVLAGCGSKESGAEGNSQGAEQEVVNLKWYQIGDPQDDMDKVEEKINEYTKEKIGATVDITQISWGDYNSKMLVATNTGEEFDLVFTCSWSHDFAQNAQKGAFMPLDDLLKNEGKDVYASVDPKFWDAATIDGKIYSVPNQKEIGSMPMWVFTKEYVDKYNIPYQDLHTLEDLEPWLKLIKEKEPELVPLYCSDGYSPPQYMDSIQHPIGIEYGDETLTVKNLYETEKMMSTLRTMHDYYKKGYINQDAATVTPDNIIKRFVTKADGQPYAEQIWGKDLGYEVVASPIMETVVTNGSARGSMTAISRTSKHPEKAMEFLNLVHTDEYLRNLLNYGIEGEHWEKVAPSDDEKKACEGKSYIYDAKVRINTENRKHYSVPYWVQGNLFTTYVLEEDPLDKWNTFKEFNDAAVTTPSFGFNFDITPVATEVATFQNILDEFGPAIKTGTVDPDVYVPKMLEKMKAAGADKVIEEMQKQIDEWKKTR